MDIWPQGKTFAGLLCNRARAKRNQTKYKKEKEQKERSRKKGTELDPSGKRVPIEKNLPYSFTVSRACIVKHDRIYGIFSRLGPKNTVSFEITILLTLPIREVPRSAAYEYEYVWVSRIPYTLTFGSATDVLTKRIRIRIQRRRPSETCSGSTEATQPYSTCVQAHSRSLRIHFTTEFAPFFHSRKVNS